MSSVSPGKRAQNTEVGRDRDGLSHSDCPFEPTYSGYCRSDLDAMAGSALFYSPTRVVRTTFLELALLTLPLSGSISLLVALSFLSETVSFWFVSAWLGLFVGLWTGRSTTLRYGLVHWPRPQSTGDNVTAALAYNSVLGFGVLLGSVAWGGSNSMLLSSAIAVIVPLWFLKHIHLFLFQFD